VKNRIVHRNDKGLRISEKIVGPRCSATARLLDVDYVWSKSSHLAHQSYRVERRTATSLPAKPKDIPASDKHIAQRPGKLKLGVGSFQDKQYFVPCIERQGESGRILREME
jgi:hypothetical protein